MPSKDLKVLIAASEVTPYVKSGGLGDVCGSLPKALRALGVDARVVFPKYGRISDEFINDLEYLDSFPINLDWRNQPASVYRLKTSDVPAYMIGNDYYFARDGIYGYGDDCERFAFFSKAAIEFLNHVDFIPDVIHFNDWQTGLGCVYLRDIYSRFLPLSKTKSLYTIHNLQYQGLFGKELLHTADLNNGYFVPDKLEFYGNISLMKAGITYADAISTVSETYSREIQTPQYGYGMDGVLREQSHKLYGILNGIDNVANDPATDRRIFANYSADDIMRTDGKKRNKSALQRQLGLPERDVPMLGIISRLADQKGLDLICLAAEEIVSKDLQMVILGTGDGRYENMFRNLAWRAPERVSANICFDGRLAQQLYASADIFLMPSLFEPCGLGQMFAMRYGTIPIVRETGGLADTVTHFDPATGIGNGFVFKDYLASGMMWALNCALETYHSEFWPAIVKNAMACDFSWEKSAEKYTELYLKLKNGEL